MSYEQIISAIEPFVEYQKSGAAPYDNISVHIGDCCLNHRDFPLLVKYLKSKKIEGWQSVPCDGFHRRSRQEWIPYLESLKLSGTEILEFTLYGGRETHDWFADYKGSFDEIHALAREWHELRGKTMWGVFVHKNNLSELTGLRKEIQDKYEAECPLHIWTYSGWGAKIEHLRIGQEDLLKLNVTMQNELSFYKSEREWIKELQSEDSAPFQNPPAVIHLAIENSGIVKIPYTTAEREHDGLLCGNIFKKGVEEVMLEWRKIYQKWQRGYPLISVLSHRFGDAGNEKMYNLASIVRKWSAVHEKEQKSAN